MVPIRIAHIETLRIVGVENDRLVICRTSSACVNTLQHPMRIYIEFDQFRMIEIRCEEIPLGVERTAGSEASPAAIVSSLASAVKKIVIRVPGKSPCLG